MVLEELLAPAGSYEVLVTAVNAGADAVYIAGQNYGARAYAKNFTIEEIEKAGLGPYYTDHGVDVYPQSAAGMPFTASYDAIRVRRIMKA